MSDISSIGPGHPGPPGIGPTHGRSASSLNGKATPAHLRHDDVRSPAQSDRIELSDNARLAEQHGKESEVRPEVIARIRKAMEDPNYLSDQKLSTALDRMIADVEENNAY